MWTEPLHHLRMGAGESRGRGGEWEDKGRYLIIALVSTLDLCRIYKLAFLAAPAPYADSVFMSVQSL